MDIFIPVADSIVGDALKLKLYFIVYSILSRKYIAETYTFGRSTHA